MAPIEYRVVPRDPAAHLFEVTLRVAEPDPAGQALRLPTWIPGSYLIREFAKNIMTIEAADESGAIDLTLLGKSRWRAAPAKGALTVTAVIYAWDLSVRMAHLDETHGYFNGTSMFLEVEGQADRPHRVIIEPPQSPRCVGWQVATTLPRISGEPLGFGVFEAPDHDALIDHPVEMGTFAFDTFEAEGVPHDVAITGRHTVDWARLRADLTKICAYHIQFFDDAAPMERYLFQVMAVGNGYGGLEHRASTSLICKRADLPQPGMDAPTPGYRNFLGLCSHEYFHTWNVKRIKPAAFLPYDLSRENHTTLLWAFEGITSYYDDLALVRCGCVDVDAYLEILGKTLTRVWRVPGRARQSLADSSYYTWTKFYRQDENSPNALISYYTKGSVVALALDLLMRQRSKGAVSLDDLMRALWQRFGKPGIGVPEDGIEALASELVGADLSDFFDVAIRGTDDPPLAELFATIGINFNLRPRSGGDDAGGTAPKDLKALTQRGELGATVVDGGGGARLKNVLIGGAAHAAGLSAGDVVVACDGLRVSGKGWVEALAQRGPGATVEVHAFRRDELLVRSVTLQAPAHDTVWLSLDDAASDAAKAGRAAWLGQ